ncbi:F-box associated interaction domain [Arabidopsis suecica]|uniref:F-box associated interaction domain n=1 Tax=Arabidopsis suecica TaxID=45249 RepID=A0A8T2B5H0_ARASU|nr:F-box associated interaction domain [Arabidopsis suecica]
MTTMISDLPYDLLSEILSRVPIKSLPKLKTTCKRWYGLFKDPDFVEKKLGKAASEMVFLMNHEVYSISVEIHGIPKGSWASMGFTGTLTIPEDSDLEIFRIHHCNGLLLCATMDCRLVVWNPCTGQITWIKPRIRYNSDDIYALGCGNNKSSSLDSYKILRCCDDNHEIRESEIYDFSSSSWRGLDGVTANCFIECNGVTLKESAYWYASDEKETPTGKFILRFDFATERFARLCLPLTFRRDRDNKSVVVSVVGEDKLALLQQFDHRVHGLKYSKIKIWMTDTKISEATHLSWSNFLVVDLADDNLPSVTSFLLDEEKRVAVCSDAVCSDPDTEDEDRSRIYIVGEDVDKFVYDDVSTETWPNQPFLVNYIPNLVHIEKDAPIVEVQKKRKRQEARRTWHLTKVVRRV